MALMISEVDPDWQADTLAYVRRLPYRNAITLSNITQLRQRCDVLIAHRAGQVQGVISHYRDLPFPAVSFVTEPGEVLPHLLQALSERVPALHNGAAGVLPEQRALQLASYSEIESVAIEMQMVVEPETLRPQPHASVRRLDSQDGPALQALAAIGDLGAWSAESLLLGPAFGAFEGDQLVAMATTRFATPDVIEIGNVVTHPQFRRRGLAAACVSALTETCFRLASRVYLMVITENESAFALYRRLGFWPAERFAFVRFRLKKVA